MTIEEMREKIEKKCISITCDEKCPLFDRYCCYNNNLTDEEIKENYKLMFGKEKLEMKNEFDFNELKAGYAIKVPAYDEILVGIQTESDIIFFNKDYVPIVDKKSIINLIVADKFIPIKVYGFSKDNFKMFDEKSRPLLYEKEDMSIKNYSIGKFIIKPNYKSYNVEKEIEGIDGGFIYMSDNDNNIVSIHKSELKGVIDALTEIYEFIKEK